MTDIMRLSVLCVAVLTTGCNTLDHFESKKEEENIKNTLVCQYQNDRLLIRYGKEEVRILMPNGERVDLYKIPASPKGTLYSNGELEFLSRDSRLTFGPPGNPRELTCRPYSLEDKEQNQHRP